MRPGDDESAIVVDSHAVQGIVGHLNAETRISLLEDDVPNVQRAVHFRGEINARPSRTPARVR